MTNRPGLNENFIYWDVLWINWGGVAVSLNSSSQDHHSNWIKLYVIKWSLERKSC